MEVHQDLIAPAPSRTPWNKGKLIGAKPPLWPKHVWSIRTKLHIEGRIRELALFNLAIDSKLRGCDVVALRVEDVAPNGYAIARATVRQKKDRASGPILTDQTRLGAADAAILARSAHDVDATIGLLPAAHRARGTHGRA